MSEVADQVVSARPKKISPYTKISTMLALVAVTALGVAAHAGAARADDVKASPEHITLAAF